MISCSRLAISSCFLAFSSWRALFHSSAALPALASPPPIACVVFRALWETIKTVEGLFSSSDSSVSLTAVFSARAADAVKAFSH